MHVLAERGEARFLLEPRTELAKNDHVSAANLREIEQIIEARLDELKRAWHAHFER